MQNFFINAKSHLLALDPNDIDLKTLSLTSSKTGSLQADLEKAQADMMTALSNSFDTPQAMAIINNLVNVANKNLMLSDAERDIPGFGKIAHWVTKMVGIFGLDANAAAPYDGLGWANEVSTSKKSADETVAPYAAVYQRVKSQVEALSIHSEALDQLLALNVNSEFKDRVSATDIPEALAYPYIRGVSRIRDELRKIAPASPSKKELLTLCDELRDNDFTNLGIYLDDAKLGEAAFIKFIPASELLAEKEKKAAKEQEKIAQKEAAKLALKKAEAERVEKAKVRPEDMFRDETKWSAWDEKGLPTKTKAGEDVPKSALKKMGKEWEKQKKVHEEWKGKGRR